MAKKRTSYNYVGQRFGRLTAVRRVGVRGSKVLWRMRCDCGNECVIQIANAVQGNTRSCGCFQRETRIKRSTKHGMSKTPTWWSWVAMLGRCRHSPKYVDRGISVCRRWRDPDRGFLNFLKDMGERPSGCTLERKNNNKGYTPRNCCWADLFTQQRNTRRTRFITFQGETLCLTDWALRIGIAPAVLWLRLRRGWPLARALHRNIRVSA